MLKVGVSDAALWVVEADKISHDVSRPLEAPDVMLAVGVWVEPDSTCPLSLQVTDRKSVVSCHYK